MRANRRPSFALASVHTRTTRLVSLWVTRKTALQPVRAPSAPKLQVTVQASMVRISVRAVFAAGEVAAGAWVGAVAGF